MTPTEIFDLIKKGDLNKIKSILAENPEQVKSNYKGTTPLHVAAENGYKDIADLLIDKGANLNAKDSQCRTPLFYAARRDHKEVADLLRQHGGVE